MRSEELCLKFAKIYIDGSAIRIKEFIKKSKEYQKNLIRKTK